MTGPDAGSISLVINSASALPDGDIAPTRRGAEAQARKKDRKSRDMLAPASVSDRAANAAVLASDPQSLSGRKYGQCR
jgi:hypothetical protein